MTAEFDAYADSYGDAVARSVAFAGKDVDFYAQRKALHLLDLAQRALGDPRSLTVLDVGCGVGITDSFLVDRFAVLHGVDTASEAVERAAARNPTARYRAYDGGTLPYDDGEVDLAFAICVAHHVEGLARPSFVAEMARVVRPGGLVVVFEHNPFNPLTRVAVSRCEFDEGVVLLRRRQAAALLRGAGLDVIEARYAIFLPLAGAFSHRVDRALRGIPLGAQHYVAGRRAAALPG